MHRDVDPQDSTRWMKRLPIVLCLCACAWLLGLIPPLFLEDPPPFGAALYDRQVMAWLRGRWDISGSFLEAFKIDGRSYMYFGPLPAVLRLPLAELVVQFPGRFAPPSIFVALVVVLWGAVTTWRQVVGRGPGIVEGLALSAPLLIIAARVAIYHEAIAWGSALALWAGLAFLRYVRQPSTTHLLVLVATAILAPLARATWSVSSVLLLLLVVALVVFKRSASRGEVEHATLPRSHALVALAGILAVGLATAGLNRLKFGAWTLAPPIAAHVVYQDPARLQRIDGRLFHLANLRTGLVNYLSPLELRLAPAFPWIHPVAAARSFPESKLAESEHFVSLPLATGALLALAIGGVLTSLRLSPCRAELLAILALSLGPTSLLLFSSLCSRYLFDFYPPLVMGAALGVRRLARSPYVRGWYLALGLLATGNLLVNAGVGVAIQRSYAHQSRRDQLERVAARFDRALGVDGSEASPKP